MITLSWEIVILSAIVILLGVLCFWLWQRDPQPGLPGVAGRDGRDGRTGRNGSLTGATAELIIELSREVEQLKQRVHELELAAQDAQGRITLLQGELALANSEVCALEQLVKEQAGRISDLRSENEQLRLSVARLMKHTGALPGIEPDNL